MHATVLFGHGSRDPLWRVSIDTVAQRMRDVDPRLAVRCAFLELTEPSLQAATQELVSLGAKRITIVPMFLGLGKHAREDTPVLVTALQATYPQVDFFLKPSVGEDSGIVNVLAQYAMPTA